MDKVFEKFTFTILKLNKLIQKIKNFEMQKFGLKTIHVMCIYCLQSNPKGLTASDLTKLTLEDKAAISRALKSLQEKGYVNYNPHKYNATILLTDEGVKLAEHILNRANEAARSGSYDFSDEERLTFYNALATIADNLTDYYNRITTE